MFFEKIDMVTFSYIYLITVFLLRNQIMLVINFWSRENSSHSFRIDKHLETLDLSQTGNQKHQVLPCIKTQALCCNSRRYESHVSQFDVLKLKPGPSNYLEIFIQLWCRNGIELSLKFYFDFTFTFHLHYWILIF